jgi:hypothetical protein
VFTFNLEASPGYLAMRQTVEPINILADIGGFIMADMAGYGESYEGNSLLFEKIDVATSTAYIDPDKARADIALGTLRAEAGVLTFGLSEGAVHLAQGDYQKAQNEFAMSAATLGLARWFGGANALDELLPNIGERDAVANANRIRQSAQGERASEILNQAETDSSLGNETLPKGLLPGQPCAGAAPPKNVRLSPMNHDWEGSLPATQRLPKSALDPDTRPYPDPSPSSYEGGYEPSDPVRDHLDPRAHGGLDDENNIDIKSRESNAIKGGREGQLLRYEEYLRENGMSEEDIKRVTADEWRSIQNDVHAKVTDPSILEGLPAPGSEPDY